MTNENLTPDSRIYIAGHSGLVGSSIWSFLDKSGFKNLHGWSSSELDLRDLDSIVNALQELTPEIVIMAAGVPSSSSDGKNNSFDSLLDSVKLESNLIEAAHLSGTKKFIYISNKSVYSKFTLPPMSEDSILEGSIELGMDHLAITKMLGLRLLSNYRKQYGHNWVSVIPATVYGSSFRFSNEDSNLIPSLINHFRSAIVANSKEVLLRGTGTVRREFIHCDDLASAVLKIIQHYNSELPINIGSSNDISLRELAKLVSEITEFWARFTGIEITETVIPTNY